jgi:hypothetical protein
MRIRYAPIVGLFCAVLQFPQNPAGGQELSPAAPAETEPVVPICEPALECPRRWDVTVDYLYWFLRRDRVGPLLTTGTRESLGVLGQPGTEILYPLDGELHSRHGRFVGVRTAAERWWDDCRTDGVMVDAFFLERDSSVLNLKDPPDGLLLARPYVDAATGRQQSDVIAGPLPDGREVAGRFYVYQRVELFGEQANWVHNLDRGPAWSFDLLAGAHFLQMRDRFDVTAVSLVLPAEAELLGEEDHFWTFDKFYGGQLGGRGEWRVGRFVLSATSVTALGATDLEINAKGDRIDHDPSRRIQTTEGLFVMNTNSGHHERWRLDWMTEASAAVGVDVTPWLRVTAGYTFLYWGGPVRATGQLDAVNLSQLTGGGGPSRPAIPFRQEAFWAQGLNVGLAARW